MVCYILICEVQGYFLLRGMDYIVEKEVFIDKTPEALESLDDAPFSSFATPVCNAGGRSRAFTRHRRCHDGEIVTRKGWPCRVASATDLQDASQICLDVAPEGQCHVPPTSGPFPSLQEQPHLS